VVGRRANPRFGAFGDCSRNGVLVQRTPSAEDRFLAVGETNETRNTVPRFTKFPALDSADSLQPPPHVRISPSRQGTSSVCAIRSSAGMGFMQNLLKAQVNRMPEGPSEAARRAGQAVLIGEARNAAGQTVRSRLRTPEGYALTALTAFDAAKRVAEGEVATGFQTPSRAFGPDYILSFDGVTLDDLNS
jgi:hypothetical protein